MSGHLEILTTMFPSKMFLTIDDIAQLLHFSKGHIYNLSAAKKLPFKVYEDTDKIQVSIIEMARYLDSKLSPVKEVIPEKKKEDFVVTAKKKVGRPRTGGKLQMTRAFQSELSMAIVREEIHQVFNSLQEQIQSLPYVDDKADCSIKFEDTKNQFMASSLQARNNLNSVLLQIKLGLSSEKPNKSIGKL